jgi:hypothetical protein
MRIFTYSQICAKVDLSKSILEKMTLKQGKFQWTQALNDKKQNFLVSNMSINKSSSRLMSPSSSSTKEEKRSSFQI